MKLIRSGNKELDVRVKKTIIRIGNTLDDINDKLDRLIKEQQSMSIDLKCSRWAM